MRANSILHSFLPEPNIAKLSESPKSPKYICYFNHIICNVLHSACGSSLSITFIRPADIRPIVFASRDEHAQKGMLAVARDLLLSVHKAAFAALNAPPARLRLESGARLDREEWDVRHVLQQLRKQVLRFLHFYYIFVSRDLHWKASFNLS